MASVNNDSKVQFWRDHFPKDVDQGQKFVTKAIDDLQKGILHLIQIPQEERTFDNTVAAYHDMMVLFDAHERIIRSERLIPDESPGKSELVSRCLEIKRQIFSDTKVINIFRTFAKEMDAGNKLSNEEWQSLKGLIQSIDDQFVSKDEKKSYDHRGNGASWAYLNGNCDSKIPSGKKFSFVNLNLCIMPGFTSMIYGGMIPWTERLDDISDKMKSVDPDIFFLQEVYDVHALKALSERLGGNYAHFYGNVPLTFFPLNFTSYQPSGLAIISKFKLDNVRFEPFQDVAKEKMTPFDRLNVFGFDRNYGIFHCDIKEGETTLAHLATAHESPFHEDIRAKQTQQIVQSFEANAKKDPNVPSIVCGDLNVVDGEVAQGIIREHFIETYREEEQGPTWFNFGPFWSKIWHETDPGKYSSSASPELDDRSLLFKGASNLSLSMRVTRLETHDGKNPVTALTDHYGLFTEVSWT